MTTHSIDAHCNVNEINVVSRDQYISNINHYHAPETGGSSKVPTTTSLNDAPLDLLSLYFTGRGKELSRISEILNVAHEDMPTRCVIHGMHGLGKSQLALQFAKLSYIRQRYSLVLWISATTVERLNHGFVKILNVIRHPDRFQLVEQSARLTEARRWLEDADSFDWLLVLDNVDLNTLDFIRENLPRRNRRGNMLFTTRTKNVALALACVAGQRHESIELGPLDIQDATRLLLTESNADTSSTTPLALSKAEEVVKCVGGLPLAISHVAAFIKQSHKELDDILHMLQSEEKIEV
jgi:hypothetical protein